MRVLAAVLVLVGVCAAGACIGVAADRSRLRRWARRRRAGAAGGARGASAAVGLSDVAGLGARDLLAEAWDSAERAAAGRAAARRAARRLEAGLDKLPIGVVLCDPRGRVVARNSAAESVTAARHSGALVADAVASLLERALGGDSRTRRVELLGDSRRIFEVSAGPVEASGEVLGAVALVRDVTEEHRIDTVRRDFVANVSHELKTPIGALSLLAESLSSDADADVLDRLAERIQSEVRRAAGMIDDLLMLSYIEDSAAADELADIDDLVRESVDRIYEAATQRGVSVISDSQSASLRVRGSRVQLVSALFNLLDNAVKFTYVGGRVSVVVRRRGGDAEITVRDDGVGIPSAEQSRIFERFYRVDRARSRQSGGTGLGLSIVRHAVLNHGGEVNVESREGQGAAFTVTLPLADALAGTDAGAPASPAAPRSPEDRDADDGRRPR